MDPRYTSPQCSRCGHTSRKNRPDQATFVCTSCGFAEHADVNAARNIAARGVASWAVSHAADDASRAHASRARVRAASSALQGREVDVVCDARSADYCTPRRSSSARFLDSPRWLSLF
ncbi:zinc ribbon domain-containing protein [Nocardia sp. CA-120079]|uniref:zinc ribbon domain-containing protein n=1 Tax=Nocardia sp. CA-120079 TaxID=3239974 RepID=UPI003D99D661